jgi:multidrug efflux system membrane fusion protein
MLADPEGALMGAAAEVPEVAGMSDPPRRRLGRWVLVGLVTVVLAGGGAIALELRRAPATQPAAADLPPATTPVTRQTLLDTQDEPGTLGYGDAYPVEAVPAGTLTWIAADGATVTRGRPLLAVDTRPVVLLYGWLPMYRTLSIGSQGADVRELEQNLAALGYGGFTVDDDFTWATAYAVDVWQHDLGVPETGTVVPGAVAVAAGPVRAVDAQVRPGARVGPGQPVLSYTGTTRLVTVDLPVADQRLARVGSGVTVRVPSGTATGTVRSVGTTAQLPSAGPPATPDPAAATVPVTVALAGDAGGGLDGAPVTVTFTAARHDNVLTVPVSALLALAEGGYGVQVVHGRRTSIVAVHTGLFAAGRVEVSAPGLTAGTLVGVPAS